MPTKSDKSQQNVKKTKPTARQLKAIPLIVTSPTYTEGCKKAKLNRTTFYQWLKNPEFKAELDRQRDEVADEAFSVLSQSLTKAVEALTGLLDTQDERLKRLVCKDIIEHILKYREVKDLEERIAALEQRLSEQNRH
ncbi:MAG: phBC6A51 family helix-turn-helix protein [Planctomycetota bacterium]|jgi:phage terminase small subunit